MVLGRLKFRGLFDYAEVAEGTPSGLFAIDGTRARRRLKVRWEDVNIARAQLVGWSEVQTDAATGKRYVSRKPPMTLDYFENALGFNWLYCTSVSVEPVIPVGTEPVFDTQSYVYGYLDCTFESLQMTDPSLADNQIPGVDAGWEGVPDESRLLRYVTADGVARSKFVNLPPGVMRVVTAPDPVTGFSTGAIIPHGIGYPLASQEIKYVWNLVPELNKRAWQNGINTINSTDFDGYAAETLRLENVEYKRHFTPAGLRAFDITYHMVWQPNVSMTGAPTPRGHNWFLRKFGDGALDFDFVEVSHNGLAGGVRPFRKTAFADLFRLDQ